MGSGEFISIEPLGLYFEFKLNEHIYSSLQLTNKTDNYVAFKVKTTNPKNYSVLPNAGIVLPRSICEIKVTMRAQKEAPPQMQCKDKFLIQSVITSPRTNPKNITSKMFTKDSINVVEECKFRVLYLPSTPSSAIKQGCKNLCGFSRQILRGVVSHLKVD